jgi:hypothetical protein
MNLERDEDVDRRVGVDSPDEPALAAHGSLSLHLFPELEKRHAASFSQ